MIVRMKKARLVVLKEERDALLRSLQRYGVFMPIQEESHGPILDDPFLQRADKTIRLMKSYTPKGHKMEADATYEELSTVQPERILLLEEIEAIDNELNRLENEILSLNEEVNYLNPWKDLDIPLGDIKPTKYTKTVVGMIEARFEDQIQLITDRYSCEFQMYEKTNGMLPVVFIFYFEDSNDALEALRNISFVEIELPQEDGLVKDILEQIQQKKAQKEEAILHLETKLSDLSKEIKELALLNDSILTKNELEKVKPQETVHTILLEGWVRKDQLDLLKQAIESVTLVYDLEITKPDKDEIPPTYTKNNAFIEPFEAITDMFSKPNHAEMDPNPVMGPWYWIIFGLMMGDAGYGLLMFILFFVMIKKTKPVGGALKLFKILMYSSITTVIWGILLGSYFGATWNPILLEPMKQPVEMLILSLILGMCHIITGIIFKAVGAIRQGRILDAIFDQFSWVFVLVGIGLLFLPATAEIGKYLALGGAGIILLTAGRKKKGIFGKITGGLGSLYGITGYMSDIFSYSRILALGLATAVIGMVMNMLAGMLQSSIIGFVFSLAVYAVGHIFNIAMGLLSAYVHDSRLQYIEFFGKFYEGGGYAFNPLALKHQYIKRVQDTKQLGGI